MQIWMQKMQTSKMFKAQPKVVHQMDLKRLLILLKLKLILRKFQKIKQLLIVLQAQEKTPKLLEMLRLMPVKIQLKQLLLKQRKPKSHSLTEAMVEVKLLKLNLQLTHLQAVIRPLAVTRKTLVRMELHPMELKMIKKELLMIKKPKMIKKHLIQLLKQEKLQEMINQKLEEMTNQEKLELMINLKTKVQIQVNQVTKNLMKPLT